ncbi:NAD(P)-dependent glycerol-3-phosphate dehydrogenase [candidate division WOR-3 bacterium]|uniref:Glycerol-3-phosphate dehydrogenase [NAD(P)+] n=1 Tax=candidate division WOR-3 bacterium TaxID=2052148 RepID=A0A937XH34_UNCW3|nr:NAD(P)-dependent glycerol-3-phosphate dehydrogenase [candidate division WOR-3 bacterium]
MRIAFVGAGRWALALGIRLSANGHEISLWEFSQTSIDRLTSTRRHPDLPEDATLPEAVAVTGDLGRAIAGAQMVVFAVPSDSLAGVVQAVKALKPVPQALVTVTKGFEPKSLKRLSVTINEALPALPVVVLAGPGIPYDVALGDPTSLVAASVIETAAAAVRDTFTGGNLRVYSHGDVVGVELGAALKNVIAIAAGVADGIGLHINAKAALLTRGLAEITRLGLAFNSNPLTFAGLSGMGDLIVTAFSDHSRNHALGVAIGRGQPTTDALSSLAGVAEGATTARSARSLAGSQRVEMPITEEVYRMLYEGVSPRDSMERLLRRSPRQEIWK